MCVLGFKQVAGYATLDTAGQSPAKTSVASRRQAKHTPTNSTWRNLFYLLNHKRPTWWKVARWSAFAIFSSPVGHLFFLFTFIYIRSSSLSVYYYPSFRYIFICSVTYTLSVKRALGFYKYLIIFSVCPFTLLSESGSIKDKKLFSRIFIGTSFIFA